jgi:hypothetical protein
VVMAKLHVGRELPQDVMRRTLDADLAKDNA